MPNFQYLTTALYQSGSTPNQVLAELPFTGVNFTQQLNSIGTFQGHLLLSGINNLNAYTGTTPAKTILWVIYTDNNGTSNVVWSGVIWHREWDSESQTLSITAQEMMSLYQRRRIATTKTYTSQDPCNIARDLLQYTEARSHGNTGLTYDSTTSGLSTNKTYNGYEYKPVYQAIKDLAQSFFDFRIQPYMFAGNLGNTFRMGIPLGTPYSSTNIYTPVFSLPGNIIKYIFPEDGISAANTLYGLGYGANSTKLVATYIDGSKIVSGAGSDWPLLEDTANYIDVGDINLLKNVTKGQGDAISYPPTTVQVVLPSYADPILGSYSIGDEAVLFVQDDFFPNGLNLIMRIVAIDVAPGENGADRVTVTLTRQLAAGTVS
jgi:hypothetical protein